MILSDGSIRELIEKDELQISPIKRRTNSTGIG